MTDRSDHDPKRWFSPDDYPGGWLSPAEAHRHEQPERARLEYARARANEHDERELYFLELAVQAPDDDSARELELHADRAYRDRLAITEEHDLAI
jgi:hypothetical protein